MTTITKIEIAALRKADSVSFHNPPNGEAYICAIKRKEVTTANPFADDIRITVPCESRLRDYEGSFITSRATFTAFDMIHSAQGDDGWQTIASLLRDGDALTLVWQRGAWSSPDLTDKGYVGDLLLLIVQRSDKRLTFAVGHYVGPRHSSARMVRNVCEAEPIRFTA